MLNQREYDPKRVDEGLSWTRRRERRAHLNRDQRHVHLWFKIQPRIWRKSWSVYANQIQRKDQPLDKFKDGGENLTWATWSSQSQDVCQSTATRLLTSRQTEESSYTRVNVRPYQLNAARVPTLGYIQIRYEELE